MKRFYVLYQSLTTWDKTLLGVIKLHEESLDIYSGEAKRVENSFLHL